jgi:protein TonB
MFTVEADGSMSDIRVIRGADPVLDAEALRVMNSCTVKWEPGIQNGKPVGVTFAFPITFQLR